MHDIKLNTPVRASALVRQSGMPGQTRTLQNANQSALEQLGSAMDTSGDPKGRILRQLRLQQGIDPSSLATQACMSLSQLYELENGGHSRFYSDSLRRQAGRRVARLLGADWDALSMDQDLAVQGVSNVVHLPRPAQQPSVSKVNIQAAVVSTPKTVEPSITMLCDDIPKDGSLDENSPVCMGLSTPASETLLVQSSSAYLTQTSSPEKSSSGWTTVLILFLVAAAGACGAYAFVEYSPYRLYWPW